MIISYDDYWEFWDEYLVAISDYKILDWYDWNWCSLGGEMELYKVEW